MTDALVTAEKLLQEAAAESLVGKIDLTGRLPISLPGLYPRGTGIQLGARH